MEICPSLREYIPRIIKSGMSIERLSNPVGLMIPQFVYFYNVYINAIDQVIFFLLQ
jgi:hypothetical protein